ncbi:MAG TPA: hypothetical protein VE197_01695, partial [Mycobacterium sp.]|nr:hypothetical protein [Mycobacterium sp.]
VAANGSQQYTIHVAAGQIMSIDLQSTAQLETSVRGENGTVLLPTGNNGFFRSVVPTSQDYIITLTGRPQATAYSMTVTVPVRISFASGVTSATVQGNLAPNAIGHYVLGGSAGQTMTIQTSTTNGQIVLLVYGADRTALIPGHSRAKSFTGTLPSTQDYFIDLESVGSAAASFSMTVTIQPR